MSDQNTKPRTYLDGLHDAAELCKAYRSHPATTEQEAIGALECAIAILDWAREVGGGEG